jgi:pimeloyl-ACP methyl ester carboxylesterase
VLIHGGWLNSRQWDEQMQRFSKSYRVIRYDCRGYGRSPMGDSAYASYEDLFALLRHLDVQRANIIGVSQGAQVAIDFAEHYPDAVQSLLLGASPLSGFDMGKEFTSGMLGVISAGASDDLELTHARMWAFAPFRAASRMPEVRKWIDDMMLREYDWAHGRPSSPRARHLDPPPAARLREIRAPTLVVVGDSDMTALIKEAEFVHSSIPKSSIVRIRNAGHFPNIERPKEFDRIALDWLKRVSGPR